MPRARGVAPPASASQSDEPAWTPTSETLRFMQGLWALVHALEVRSKRMSRTMGVTGPQRLVLRVIGQRPDATAGDIARMLDLHASTLTGVLARLEERGMLARHVDPGDRRRARFTLTAAGRRADREQKGTVEAAVRRALARVPARQAAQVRALLATLVVELGRPE
jgi:DNA-binding MarR family transcriptional regulator